MLGGARAEAPVLYDHLAGPVVTKGVAETVLRPERGLR